MKYRNSLICKILKYVILDIFLAGIIILLFGLYHHGFAAILTYIQQDMQNVADGEFDPSTLGEETALPTQLTTVPAMQETVQPATDPTEADDRTEWQIKFAEHFTEEIIVTENSYSSPNVSIKLETKSFGSGKHKVTYHIADVYVASLDCFKTYTAHNKMEPNSNQFPLEMDNEAGAILSVTGDYYTLHKSGFILRNGILYVNDSQKYDICVLYGNGELAVYDKYSYDPQQILDNGAVQVWNFGPGLLDENGKVKQEYDIRRGLQTEDPRTGIGYYEPGHYCFVVVDGRREGYSEGVRIEKLAEIFQDLGCRVAYNLDGGGSALMVFDDKLYTRPSESRRIGDFIIVTEPEMDPQESDQEGT